MYVDLSEEKRRVSLEQVQQMAHGAGYFGHMAPFELNLMQQSFYRMKKKSIPIYCNCFFVLKILNFCCAIPNLISKL